MNWKTIVSVIGMCVAVAVVVSGIVVVLLNVLDNEREAANYIECACEPDAL